MLADLTAMAPLDRRRWVLGHAITPALAELPPMPSEAAARVMLLAVAGVESGCLYRRQVPVAHAMGLWQFERLGGVALCVPTRLDPAPFATIADRLLLLQEGQVRCAGAPADGELRTALEAVFRHAIKLAKLQGQRELVQSHIGTWRLSNKRKQLSN